MLGRNQSQDHGGTDSSPPQPAFPVWGGGLRANARGTPGAEAGPEVSRAELTNE